MNIREVWDNAKNVIITRSGAEYMLAIIIPVMKLEQ